MKRYILFGIICIFLSEVLLRFFYLPPELNTEYYQNRILWLQQHSVINSVGYRDYEHELERGNEDIRIYAMGDSNSYGWYINNPSQRYTSLIEKALSKNLEKKVEVINAAQFGFSIKDQLERFKNEGKYYHPDVITVTIFPASVNISNSIDAPADYNLPDFIKQLRIYQLLLGQKFIKDAENNNRARNLGYYTDPNSSNWIKSAAYLKALKKEADSIEAKLVIILLPQIEPKNTNAEYTFYPYHKKFKEFGKQNAIVIVDPLSEFLKYSDKRALFINPLDSHISENLHTLIADAFVRQTNSLFQDTTQKHLPSYKHVELTKDDLQIGAYQSIRAISATQDPLPWVYYEKSEKDFQNFPLQDTESRQNHIYSDRIYTGENNGFGPEIIYHVYPKNPGYIEIPATIGKYPVIGFNEFSGIYQVLSINAFGYSPMPESFTPTRIQKKGDIYQISYDPKRPYDILQVKISIAVNQITVQNGTVSHITQNRELGVVVEKDSSTIAIPFSTPVLGFPQLWEKSKGITSIGRSLQTFIEMIDPSKKLKNTIRAFLHLPSSVQNQKNLTPMQQQIFGLKTYAWVDGIFTPLKNAKQENNQIILTFNTPVKKGQHVIFGLRSPYPWKENEVITLDIEEEKIDLMTQNW